MRLTETRNGVTFDTADFVEITPRTKTEWQWRLNDAIARHIDNAKRQTLVKLNDNHYRLPGGM